MSSRLKLAGICFAAAFALAACGGGGGSGSGSGMMPPPDPPQPPPMEPMEPTGPTPEEVAATTKSAKTKLDAIMAEAGLEAAADSGLGGTSVTATGNNEGAYTLSVERDGDGTTVTVTIEGATDAADEDFEQAMDLGGGLTMHTRDAGMGMTEIAMVMTDIEAPKAVAFAKWDNDNNSGNALPQLLNVDEDGTTATGDDAVAFDPGGPLTSNANAAQLKLIMATRFAAPGDGSTSVTHTFNAAVEANPSADPPVEAKDAAEVMGTYNGAIGTYTCTGTTDCTVAVNAKGELINFSDGWIFTPAEGATSDQPDYDYLNYGFWLKKTTKDGETTYDEVAPFHMAVGMADSSGTVTGSASYEGSAVGVYVHNVLSEGGGSVESRTAGHFTADAALKAYFGQPAANNIPPNKLGTLTGTIDNFMLSGGERQDWSVALQASGIDLSAANTFSGTANGGGAAGTVNGNFYGGEDTVPGAVTGEFNANFSNGAVAGAFGAREKK